ncbi:hypothetical protein MSAN_00331500 [Mycena sanguinolenta]|uniref:Uncharacterized protein n=1 Tax=Mycena sanguinolenta TaxID=230812 RepID=A0A8H7DIH5_9AGAR|nr:hypothetical protein MSAN_00331500 [Mycena sanguinolenta]
MYLLISHRKRGLTMLPAQTDEHAAWRGGCQPNTRPCPPCSLTNWTTPSTLSRRWDDAARQHDVHAVLYHDKHDHARHPTRQPRRYNYKWEKLRSKNKRVRGSCAARQRRAAAACPDKQMSDRRHCTGETPRCGPAVGRRVRGAARVEAA